MRFENIQTKEDLRNFFISRGFEIQKHDETLIKIDNLPHFLKIEYVDDLDFKKVEQIRKKLRNLRNVPYQLLVDKSFQKFIFQRDYGTPLRFSYDRTKHYARETEGSIFKKLNLLKFEDSDFNTSINNLFDVKEIVNKFYEEYKRIRKKLSNAIKNLDEDSELYAQIIMDRIIFLYFLQTKGILPKTFLSDLYYNKKKSENFYRDYLIPLFFQMLNTEKHSKKLIRKFGSVPYLNGGLFSPKEIEIKNGEIQISDSVWDYVFKLLNGYEWVIEEDKGDSTTLTPSILGHIYEKSVIAATQKETGSYYTPEEITTYISKNTIYPYITDRVNEKFNKKYKNIWKELLNKTQHTKEELEQVRFIYFDVLKNLKICDNACGSGAFLIAAKQILLPIYWACIKILLNKPFFRDELANLNKYRNWNYYLKREIITKNLYGVDIQEGAVEIAKLRLWLSMVSEMELKAEDIEPLPNIDYNLLAGNSLIGYIKLPERWGSTLFDDPKKIKTLLEERQKLINIYRDTRSSIEAKQLEKDIERINKKIREELDEMLFNEFKAKGIKITKEEFKNLKPFHWGFEFYDVFNGHKSDDEKGFDVIIGNPPYFSIDPKLKRITDKEHLYFRNIYKTFHGQTDIFVFFYERGINLLKQKGVLGFISKNRWQNSPSYKAFCDYLVSKNLKIIDFDDTFVFVGVGVTTNIIIINKDKEPYIEYWLFNNSGISNLFNPLCYEINKRIKIKKGENWDLLSNDITEHLEEEGQKILIGGCGHKITPSKFFIIKKLGKNEFEPEDLEIKSKVGRIRLLNKELKYILKFVSSGDIFSYHIRNKYRYIFYLKNANLRELPNIKKYFEKIKPKRACKRWYEFHCGHGYRNVDLIEKKEKIIFPNRMYVNRKCSFYFDNENILIGMDCSAAISKNPDVHNKSILVILNSTLMWYYLRRKFKRYANRQTVNVEELPIKLPQNQEPFIALCNYMLFLNKTESRRKSEKELIEFIDKQIIDPLVYELYFGEIIHTPKDIINFFKDNKKVFNQIFKEIFEDKPTYKKLFVQKKNEIYKIIESAPEILKGLSAEGYKIIEENLTTAKEDISGCERDFKADDLWHALYRFQQAIEKLVKSYGLYLGLFKEKDLKPKVGHIPLKIYIRLLEQSWITKVKNLFGFKINISENLRQLKSLTDIKDKTTKEELLKLDKDVPAIVALYKKTCESLNKSFSRKETRELVEMFKSYRDIENYYRVMFGFSGLLLPLSVIVPVFVDTRYAEIRRSLNIKPKEMEIIKNLKKIVLLLEENIKKFSKLIKEEKEKKVNSYFILLSLIKPYLKDIENLKSDDEKLRTIKQIVEKIKSDDKIMKEIKKIKSHRWVRIIEGAGNV